MKELNGSASTGVSAPIEDCFALLIDLERYPAWYPETVREATVTQRDAGGHPSMVRTTLHASIGPLAHEFHLLMAVLSSRPTRVKLTRVPHDAGDRERFEVTWRLEPAAGTRISVDLAANLSLPRLLPVGGVGDAMAGGFVRAAANAVSGAKP